MRDNLVTNVYYTEDYGKFKFLNGNREINNANLQRIKKSIEGNPLITIIIVNENMEIIDGQHRFLVAKELGLPIYYIILPGYGLKECQILNANTTNWKYIDYLDGYASLGNENYINFKKFMDRFPDIKNFTVYIFLLQGSLANYSASRSLDNDFKDGMFQIKDIDEAVATAEKLMDFKVCTKTWSSAIFKASALKLLRLKKYDHEKMKGKLKYLASKVELCATKNGYYDQFSYIYNYRARKDEEKVFFRYEL